MKGLSKKTNCCKNCFFHLHLPILRNSLPAYENGNKVMSSSTKSANFDILVLYRNEIRILNTFRRIQENLKKEFLVQSTQAALKN